MNTFLNEETDMSITRERENIRSLIVSLQENINELEVAIKSNIIKNASLSSLKKTIKDATQQIESTNNATIEKYIAIKNQLRNESDHVQLILQCKDILINMNKLIPTYRTQITLLKTKQIQLQSLLNEIKDCNTHLDKEDSEFFSSLNDTIEQIIKIASQYRGNGFEDAIDNASDMHNLSVSSITTLEVKHKKLIELNTSITNCIENMTQHLSLFKSNIAERKKNIADKINNNLTSLQADIIRLEETHKKISEIKALLTTKFKFDDTLSLISATLSEYQNELQKIKNQHGALSLSDQGIAELSNFIYSQNYLSNRVNSINKTLDNYLIEITQQYNAESKIKPITETANKQSDTAVKPKIEEELLQLQNDLNNIENLLQSTREINAKIYQLDLYLKKYNTYSMLHYPGMDTLQTFATFTSTIASSASILNTITLGKNNYQTLINDITLLLKKTNEIKTENDESNNMKKQLAIKLNELFACKQKIKTQLNSIEQLNKTSAHQLATASSAIKSLPEAINQSTKTLQNQYNNKKNDISKDFQQTIDSLNKEQAIDDMRTKQQISKHIPAIASLQQQFNATQNAHFSKAKTELDEYSNTFGSIILSWLASWIPFIKDKKKDQLTAKVNGIQSTNQLFNQHCDQLKTLFSDNNNHHLIKTQIKVIEDKQARSKANYPDNGFISLSYTQLQTITKEANTLCQQHEIRRLQNEKDKQQALQQRDALMSQIENKFIETRDDAANNLRLTDQLTKIVAIHDLQKSTSPLTESTKPTSITNTVSSFFKKALDEASQTVVHAINDTYTL